MQSDRLRSMSRLLIIAAAFLSVSSVHAQRLPTEEPFPVNKLESNIAYIQFRRFSADMTDRIRPTLQLASAMKPRGIIIDVRNNQGGDIKPVHTLLEALLPKGTPYMRHLTPAYRRIVPTTQMAVVKKSTPIVVIRDAGTGNEADIVVYALQKLRGARVVEFTNDRSALKRTFKQQARMDQYRPIKESVFFVTPDLRLIASEGAGQEDVIARTIVLIREMSPWGEPKKSIDPQ